MLSLSAAAAAILCRQPSLPTTQSTTFFRYASLRIKHSIRHPLAPSFSSLSSSVSSTAAKTEEDNAAESKHEDYGEVNKIKGSRVAEGRTGMEYLIEWKDDHPDTWEPPENIATDVLTEYIAPWWQAAKTADCNKLAELIREEEEEVEEQQQSRGRDVNAIDENLRTALMFAAGLGGEECVKFLVNAGADIDWQDKEGFTPLHMAAGYVQLNTVKCLLELGADPDLEDSKGRTPLQLATHLLNATPKANPMQFARRLTLDQIVKLLNEASYETAAVEQIMDKRIVGNNETEYLVKWGDDSECSWVAAADVAEDLTKDFEAGLEYGIVEKILDKRIKGKQVEYLIKWADSDANSWEPQDNVAAEVIQEFEHSKTESEL